ncbi:hypothetical protein L494_4556 [Bordetella bronchiseptica CA90 BB1334]|nr:hypothetical protein L494_4556 [Bordetella bronchiseptica CA90 BB1334]
MNFCVRADRGCVPFSARARFPGQVWTLPGNARLLSAEQGA